MRGVQDDQRGEMKRLDKEVARLGQENNDLRQRVLEVEGVNASQLDRIAGLERRKRLEDLGSGVAGASAAGVSERPAAIATREAEAPVRIAAAWRSGVAGASVAGVSEIPEDVPVVGERKRAKRVASTSDREIEWKHPEAKGGETATSRGDVPCKYCHGGICLTMSKMRI